MTTCIRCLFGGSLPKVVIIEVGEKKHKVGRYDRSKWSCGVPIDGLVNIGNWDFFTPICRVITLLVGAHLALAILFLICTCFFFKMMSPEQVVHAFE